MRGQYEKALERYWRERRLVNEQRRLRFLKEDYLPILQKGLLWLYSGPSFYPRNLAEEVKMEQLEQDLKMYVEDPGIRKVIMEGLKERKEELAKPVPRRKLGPRGRREGCLDAPGFQQK